MQPTKNKTVNVQHLGLKGYSESWDYQTTLFQDIISRKMANRDLAPEVQEPTPNYLLFCQHPHVYTLGRSGSKEHLLIDEATLQEKEATYIEINRGGDITYHGPGQLVVYPIFDLDNFFTDIHRYMRALEEAVIRTLADYGLDSGRVEGLTGVWLGYDNPRLARKICAMGVKTSRWVTMHGLALNVNTDLSYFNHIVPCGITDKAVTSLDRELGRTVDMDELAFKMLQHLSEVFEFQAIPGPQISV